jgi:hypothetical protein
MKCLYAHVTNVKAYPSTGIARVEIEVPVEHFPVIVGLLMDKQVLVTIAPQMLGAYGVYDSERISGGSLPPPPPPAPPREELGARCKWAVMRCGEKTFQDWMLDRFPDLLSEETPDEPEQTAKWLICRICGITSRKLLDENINAGKKFDEQIRTPFAESQR